VRIRCQAGGEGVKDVGVAERRLKEVLLIGSSITQHDTTLHPVRTKDKPA
jgi:hypothetical protein